VATSKGNSKGRGTGRIVRIRTTGCSFLPQARAQGLQCPQEVFDPGIVDERPEVVDHWREAKTWIVAPVAVDADLLGGGGGLELLVGYTRLGNLLGSLDRQEVSEIQKYVVWVGRRTVIPPRCGRSRIDRPQLSAA